MLSRPASQRGVVLIISIIMLVLMTLFVLSSINLGNANLKQIARLQTRRALEAVAQQAIERVASKASNFVPGDPDAETGPRSADINGTSVLVAAPVCLQATRAAGYELDSALAPQDTYWDVRASARDRTGNTEVVVHEGFQIRLPPGNCAGATPAALTGPPVAIKFDRGGRMLSAVDISDPNAPKAMWHKGCPGHGTEGTQPACDAGYAEIGQIWSRPTVAKIRFRNSASAPAAEKFVLIFGAGFDPATDERDPDPPSGQGSGNTTGRGIYLVDLTDGSVLWRAGPAPGRGHGAPDLIVGAMTYSIPSDVAAIDRNADGYIDRAYVGDTGGNVWRLDLADPYPGNWTVNRLASLGYAQSANLADRRKFFHRPSVVAASDAGGPYDAVLIGSGDRAHLMNGCADRTHPRANSAADRFYMLKDRSVGDAWGLGRNNRPIPVTTITDGGWRLSAAANPDLADVSVDSAGGNNASSVANARGWFISLTDGNPAHPVLSGEKTAGTAITVAGIVYFASYRPAPDATGACGGNPGEARTYRLNFANGSALAEPDKGEAPDLPARFRVRTGGGLLPSPALVLKQPKADTAAGATQLVCYGTDCEQARAPALGARIRSYTYAEGG